MSVDFSGLKELQKNLKDMERSAQELNDGISVTFDELFSTTFMKKHTKFKSIDEFLEDGNFPANSQEDFEKIPDEELDKHVINTTSFDSWENMFNTAAEAYTLKRLGL